MKIKITISLFFPFFCIGLFAQSISINPTNANKVQSLPVTITGLATNFSRGSNTVSFIKQGSATSQINISNLTVLNNSIMGGIINVSSGADVGAYTVRVTNPQNSTINLTNGFTVNASAASITNITPSTGSQGQSLAVSITGTNTSFSQGSNTVKFFKQGTEVFDVVELYNTPFGNNLLTANLLVSPQAPLGVYSVGVETLSDGLLMLNNSFTVTQSTKSLVSITPNVGEQGETLIVTIIGAGTSFNVGSPSFYFIRQGSPTNDIEQLSATATSATSVNVQLKINQNTDIGLYDLGYFNIDDGAILKPSAFTVNQKTISVKEVKNNVTKIYPNPIKSQLNIASKVVIQQIDIFDITGKLITTKIPDKETNLYQINMDDMLIPKGIYYLKIITSSGINTHKVIID